MYDGEIYNHSSSGMSNNPRSLYSTPVKASFRTGHSKPSASEERSYIRDPETDDNFITTHFSSPTNLSVVTTNVKQDSAIQIFLLKLAKGSKEDGMYDTLAGLFNKVAALVSDDEPMLFHPSKNIGPSGENRQEDRSLVPDFSILPMKQEFTFVDKHDTLRIPWSTLESYVEVKTKKRSDHQQSIDYIETLLQYRPDKVFALGMSCNEHIYQFYYADACIQKLSPEFSWKGGLGELAQFIHTLHLNYKNDIGRDASYTLHDIRWFQNINASARWRVSFDERTHEVQRMFARKGTGRRTWLGIGYEESGSSTVTNNSEKDKVRIVKDMWRDASRRFKESEILNQIHKDGYIAGVVRHISADSVDELTVKNSKTGMRIKERVVMASTGLRLNACESVLDFLKVMYDLVETHEQLLEKRGVLHRDLSWYNVLCKPEHFTDGAKVVYHPTIGQLLGKQGKECEPLCLLTDFDNASLTEEDNSGNAAERTGTPMFIACELAYGSFVGQSLRRANVVVDPNQFNLEGNALEAYLKVYGGERYSDYEIWLRSIISGSGKVSNAVAADVLHQPIHDMESVFWLILWFIIKAWPPGADFGPNIPEPDGHKVVKNLMLTRQIGDESQAFTIIPSILLCGADNWKSVLNPVYEPLIGMLVNMSQYLCMRWSDFSAVHTWHAHEAFKRLLLKEIFRMTNDNCPIPIQGPRPPPPKSVSAKRSTTKAGKKASQIPPQAEPSSHGFNVPETQSMGSQKRPNSNTTDSAPPSKRSRRMETDTVENNPNPLALRIIDNLANDAWWFV